MTIVPSRAMQLMERAFFEPDAQVQIAARANDILVSTPRVTIYSRLVEGRFPRWRDVFPQRQDAQQDRAADRAGPCRRPPGGDRHQRRKPRHRFQVRRRHVDVGWPGRRGRRKSHVELPIAYTGPAVSITLDPRYMSDFLKVLDAEKTFTWN